MGHPLGHSMTPQTRQTPWHTDSPSRPNTRIIHLPCKQTDTQFNGGHLSVCQTLTSELGEPGVTVKARLESPVSILLRFSRNETLVDERMYYMSAFHARR